jgi:hypothetical protein
MSLAGFNRPARPQCAIASIALPWQGQHSGDCCGPQPAPDQVDPCNVVLDTVLVQRLFAQFNLIAQQSRNVPPLEADLRASLRPSSCALVFVDLGSYHYMIVCTFDPTTQQYGVANPAVKSAGLIAWSWSQLNVGAGLGYLWRITAQVTAA